MNGICVRRRLESATLHLPELKPLVGKEVEIIVREAQDGEVVAGTGDWEAAARAAEELRETGYDFDAWREQRECDQRQAHDHQP